jgi:hypothetical protein
MGIALKKISYSLGFAFSVGAALITLSLVPDIAAQRFKKLIEYKI